MTATDEYVLVELWGGPRDGEILRFPTDEIPQELRIPMAPRLLPDNVEKGWFRYRYWHMRSHVWLYKFDGEHHI